MIASRAKAVLVLGALAVATPAAGQNFDDRPTGFLNARTGGMPADAWAGTGLARAKQLVSALSPAPRSRALRDLQFKVMVSELTPPAADGSAPLSLFARKADRLAAMGEGESLNEMVRGAGAYADPNIAAVVVNALMLAGEREGACAIARANPLAQPFAQRAEIACRVAAGEAAPTQAMMAGGADGPTMLMLAVSGEQPPAALMRTTQPALMRALVAHKTLPLAVRVDIAERGEALAIIEATRLGDLYLQAVNERVALPPPTLRRAQLVAMARGATNAQEIMSSVATVYSESRGTPMFPTVARASSWGLLNLPPQAQYANVAQEAMRGFLLLGDRRLTEAWTKLALNAAYNNARAMLALERMMPLVIVAGIDKPNRIAVEDANRWYEIMRNDEPERAQLRGNVLLELFRAVGFDVPPRSTDLPETPPANVRLVSLPPQALQALQVAAQAGRRAETALIACGAVGETALTDLHPASVGAIVRALRAAGEDHAARLFAVEVAIAHGL
jgi:hypothetical protein